MALSEAVGPGGLGGVAVQSAGFEQVGRGSGISHTPVVPSGLHLISTEVLSPLITKPSSRQTQ